MRYLILLLALSTPAVAAETVFTTKQIQQTVQQTAAIATKFLKSKDFKTIKVIDHAKAAKNVGIKLPESRLIIFGKPKAGSKLITENPQIGFALPLKLHIYQARGAVWLAHTNPAYLREAYGITKNQGVIKKMDGVMKELRSLFPGFK